jgi:hypothetical protein
MYPLGVGRNHTSRWWVFVCTTLSGCCVTIQDAEDLDKQLIQENRERAVPEMQRAAARLGATLLDGWAYSDQVPRYCNPPEVTTNSSAPVPPRLMSSEVAPKPEVRCIEATFHDTRVLQILEEGKTHRVWIALRGQDRGAARYARLAQRGNEMIVLVPKIARDRVDNRTLCECDTWPRVVLPEVSVFTLPAIQVNRVRDVLVPVIEEAIDWECGAGT